MKIVVDTNIVFSALLNSSGNIGEILIGTGKLQFYSCDFLRIELVHHHRKLLQLTGLNPKEMEDLQYLVTKNITFLHENVISPRIRKASIAIMKNIDLDDAPFVALAKQLDATLWTGDRVLIKGLKKTNFISVVNTTDLSKHI